MLWPDQPVSDKNKDRAFCLEPNSNSFNRIVANTRRKLKRKYRGRGFVNNSESESFNLYPKRAEFISIVSLTYLINIK